MPHAGIREDANWARRPKPSKDLGSLVFTRGRHGTSSAASKPSLIELMDPERILRPSKSIPNRVNGPGLRVAAGPRTPRPRSMIPIDDAQVGILSRTRRKPLFVLAWACCVIAGAGGGHSSPLKESPYSLTDITTNSFAGTNPIVERKP